MAITIFSTLEQQIQNAVDAATSGLQSTYMTDMAAIATAGGTLYVLFYGYSVIAGKIDSPISDFVWNIARMCLIMAFVTNAGGLLTLASEAVRALESFATHGTSVWSVLDSRANNIATLVNKIWQDADGVKEAILAILRIVALFPLILGVAAVAKDLAFAAISLTILIVVMPIFVFCLMYGFLKQMFAKFLALIFTNVLKILFITVLSDVAFRIIAYVTADSGNIAAFSTTLIYLLGGLLCMSVASLGSSMAESIAEVSIENTVAGKLGASARSAADMGKNAARGSAAAARSAINTARDAKSAGRGAGGQVGAVAGKAAMAAANATPIGRVGVGVAKAVVNTMKSKK